MDSRATIARESGETFMLLLEEAKTVCNAGYLEEAKAGL